ncbi:PaaI family thioesterase [Bacillus marinisedimentorum]|uniref:PaaI family thioesterase n=1 Tax=Bacillus marinisedimentorum TaxID=1821260 RepID=UPI0008730583|nr:PaaI family thioesterase [Bacillus marinisedimentorum]
MNNISKKQLKESLSEFIDAADQAELEVMNSVLTGVSNKKEKNIATYINALFHFETHYEEGKQSLEIIMPNEQIVMNSLDMTHGGVTATLLDTAMGTLVNKVLPEGKKAVTTEIKVNYLAPGKGKYLRTKANIVQIGSKIAFCDGQVFREDGKLAAYGTGSFFIIG